MSDLPPPQNDPPPTVSPAKESKGSFNQHCPNFAATSTAKKLKNCFRRFTTKDLTDRFRTGPGQTALGFLVYVGYAAVLYLFFLNDTIYSKSNIIFEFDIFGALFPAVVAGVLACFRDTRNFARGALIGALLGFMIAFATCSASI